ncbi:MAG: zf-TFIIB domain-containing protein [Gemmatimonadales bacterium]
MASSKPRPEARQACPVCLGVQMSKIQPDPSGGLVLDHCTRCGGMWLDKGEVPRLRRCRPQALWALVTLSPDAYRMQCHSCHAAMDRNAVRCPTCAWRNELACPGCGGGLRPVQHGDRRLDVCGRCSGVWFDNVELASIWNEKVHALEQVGRRDRPTRSNRDYFLLESVLYAPDLVGGATLAVGDALVGGVHSVSAIGVGEAASAVVEGTGALAGSVFEAIAEIVGGIFS